MLIIVFFAYVSFIKCIALEVQFNISFLIKKQFLNLILWFQVTKRVPYFVTYPVEILGVIEFFNNNRIFEKFKKILNFFENLFLSYS